MTITRESPDDGSVAPEGEGRGAAPAALTLESIQSVRDFTARKTLEQAYAFVTGLRALLRDGAVDESDRALLRDLERAGIGPEDADQIAAEAVALMEIMADRDRKADVFHAAVKAAGQSERAMYERLASVARALREELGGRAPALAKLGVPSLGGEAGKARPRTPSKGIFSAAAVK
ncbi:MAG: hypothetical protein QM820_05620 [Minicystis sp.]